MELALVENLQREDLTPIEEASAYRLLMDEFGLTQEAVASRVGKSRPAVANALRLLGLPDVVKAMVERGELSAAHARSVLTIEGGDARIRFARDLVERGVPKSGAERLAQARRTGKSERGRGSGRKAKEDPNARSVADRLTRALGTKVRVSPRRRGGVIEIEYYSNEELDRLLARIAPGTEAF